MNSKRNKRYGSAFGSRGSAYREPSSQGYERYRDEDENDYNDYRRPYGSRYEDEEADYDYGSGRSGGFYSGYGRGYHRTIPVRGQGIASAYPRYQQEYDEDEAYYGGRRSYEGGDYGRGTSFNEGRQSYGRGNRERGYYGAAYNEYEDDDYLYEQDRNEY